jgi:DnaK suppressor protein
VAINDSLSAPAFPVRAGEDPWTEQEVQEIQSELVAEIDRLTSELAAADQGLSELLRNSGDGAGDDQADSGSSALEREHELTLVNNTRDMLEQTTRALARIEAGTFGRCDSCGEAIGKARVQAFPRATLCVSCKQREERR